MKLQPARKKILEYLQEYGSSNTFKLSRDLKIERSELISLVEELTKEGLTKFRSGTVIKGDKPAAEQKIIESEEKKPVSKPILTLKKSERPKSLKDSHSELNAKEKIKRTWKNWLKKEEELKKDIEDLQTQRGKTAQKLSKEKALLCQIRKEKKELEKSLAVWESSLNQREESVQRKEEDIQKREEFVSVAEKRLEREKQRIAKARALKKDINKLEATLADSEKRVSIEKEGSKQPKEKKAKPKAVSKRVKKPKRKELVQRKEKHKLERLSFRKGKTNLEKMRGKAEHFDKIEEPELKEQGYEKIRLEEEKIEDTSISGFENVLETKPTLEKESFPSLRSDDFEEPEQIKPTLKSKIKGIIEKIRVSKSETKSAGIIAKESWQPMAGIGEEKFHNLIEQEISLLKQKRIDEARNIHLQIKDMISEVTVPIQRKMIIKEWNRVKEFY